MADYAGDFDLTETVVLPFNTFDSNDPAASVTVTNLVAGDVYVHKDGVEGTPGGITVSLNVGAVNGNHYAALDLSNTTDPGFYAVGSRYQVRIEGATVDGGTINAWIGTFSIGCLLRSTVAGRTLDVSTGGEAGIDWANVGTPGTTVDLSATSINLCDTVTTLTGHTAQTGDSFARIGVAGAGLTNINLPNQTMDIVGNITGNLSGSVGSVSAGGITAASIATDAIDADALAADAIAEIADQVWDEAASGHVSAGTFGAYVAGILVDTGEIGTAGAGLTNINLPNQTMDIVGNITGNLSGSVGSVSAGGITAASIATDAVDADALAADALAEINAQVVDVLKTDTSTLAAQGAPSATPTLEDAIMWLYKLARNKTETTATTISVYDDAGSTVDHKSTISDDTTTFTRGEFATGP